jgi:hypothetical protein
MSQFINESKPERVPEYILREIDDALDSDNAASKSEMFDSLIDMLRTYRGKRTNGEADFLTGYLYYLYPNRSESKNSLIRDSLERAISISSDPSVTARSKLYLGHLQYDEKNYHYAKRYFDSLDVGSLPKYLQLKALEMRLCCSIRIDSLNQSLDTLSEFIDQASTFPIQDVFPQELARTLRFRKWDLNKFEIHYFKKLMRALDNTGQFSDWFSSIDPSR